MPLATRQYQFSTRPIQQSDTWLIDWGGLTAPICRQFKDFFSLVIEQYGIFRRLN
jgi:hypothetical protein